MKAIQPKPTQRLDHLHKKEKTKKISEAVPCIQDTKVLVPWVSIRFREWLSHKFKAKLNIMKM